MESSNFIFTVIFIVEAALKIFVFRWAYFKTSWNKFDFFVVLTSIFDIIMTANMSDEVSESALAIAP